MNEKSNKTAVEWLIDQMLDSGIGICKEWREQAKQMEKEQIIYAHLIGLISSMEMEATKQAEQYYQENYGK